jgi:hypothetical protein
MEEERIELAELDKSKDVREGAKGTLAEEIALTPEVAARQLFASYLEPSEDEQKQEEAKEGDLPESADGAVA